MNAPTVSIITVCHNALPELQRTVSSLYKLKNFAACEWIIIDRSSKDGTAAWLQQLHWPNTRFISERDSGLNMALNKGVSMARGEWLWFLNPGDTMQPAILEGLPTDNTSPVLFLGCRLEGKVQDVKRFGFPYPFNAMLLRGATGLKFNDEYKNASEYDYMLAHLRRTRTLLKNVPLVQNSQYMDIEPPVLTPQQRALRDVEGFVISWRHLGMNLSLFWYAARMSVRLIDRVRPPVNPTAEHR